jgi:outer membrane protein OmpA-like peptidoglycan-associated protein
LTVFLPNSGYVKTYFLILFTVFCLFIDVTLLAQKTRTKFKKSGVVKLQDSLTSYGQSDIFEFPNINLIKRYQDAEKLKLINQLQASYADHELYTELRSYVRNFGIENFSANTNMIWKLAQLSQEYGPPGESLLLYKMVLKHNRRSVDGKLIQGEYDSITKNIKDNYVPLDYYYELVNYRKEIDTLQPPRGVLLNMGEWINSPKADYAPTIGNIDTLLLFTSKRNSNIQSIEKTYNEDIFFTTKFNGQWMEAQPFKNINTRYNEGSACLSKDGRFLYFAKCNSPDSYGNCDIFVAELRDDKTWGAPHNLGKNINTVSWDSHPSLSHSGDTLFFASDRIGGLGLSDIYYTVRDEEGKWQRPENIGPIINTRGNEVSPFYHHKFNVLYFSSNGQPVNFGDFDIYKSYKIAKDWGEPKNIGPLVNGIGTEYYFTIDSESSELYYARSSEDDINNLDLNSFPVPMEAQPEAVARLKGSLLNSETKKPLKGIVSVIDLDKGVEVAPKFIRDDGSFDFSLINKRNYLLIIQGDDFFRIEELFFMDGDMEINKETEPIESKIAFKSLEFENGKADILPSMHSDMDKLANFMIDHPRFKLNISGHTDMQGKEDANLRLSQARADAIKAYLIYEYKIESSRIDAHGYGSSKPIVEEANDDHRKLNRRVEFDIVKE